MKTKWEVFKENFETKRQLRKEVKDLQTENLNLRAEKVELQQKLNLVSNDNREIGNKVIVALEEIKDLKKENKRLKRQLKETK